jgi:biotin carboxyl carrier protein
VKFSFDHNAETVAIDLTPAGETYRVTIVDRTVDVEVLLAKEGVLDLLVDGAHVTAYVSIENAKRWVTINGQTFVLTKSSGARRSGQGGHHAAGELTAPMPGQVRAVNVNEGDRVTKGQTLIVLEAMKMEVRIQASKDGQVIQVFVKQGQIVDREQILIEIA